MKKPIKKIGMLSIVGLVAGAVSFGAGCGSSTSSGGSGNVSGALNSIPTASLSVSNVGGAAGQVISSVVSQGVPTDVSSVVSAGPQVSILAYVLNNANTLVVRPQSFKGAALNALSVLKLAATSGSGCSPSSIVDNSTGTTGSGTVDLTLTWTKVSCVDPSTGNTQTLNGTASLKGSYDSSVGDVSINTTLNLTIGMQFTSGGSEQVSVAGSIAENGTGLVQGTTSVSFANKGSITLTGSVSSAPSGDACNDTITGTFSGWENVDNAFSGSPSQLAFSVDDGNEMDASGTSSGGGSLSLKQGAYNKASMTISVSSSTTRTVNGTGTFGAVITESGTSTCGTIVTSSTSYAGKFTATLTNVTFDDSSCNGQWPTGGTLTLTADKTLTLNFTGQACDCADVSVNGGTASQVCGIK